MSKSEGRVEESDLSTEALAKVDSSQNLKIQSETKDQIPQQARDDNNSKPVTRSEQSEQPVNSLINNKNTINEPKTNYSATSLSSEALAKEDKQIEVIEIFVKKDTDIEELKNLSSFLKTKAKDEGVEIFVHIPNHKEVRKIKLEGKYDPEIKDMRKEMIERMEVK